MEHLGSHKKEIEGRKRSQSCRLLPNLDTKPWKKGGSQSLEIKYLLRYENSNWLRLTKVNFCSIMKRVVVNGNTTLNGGDVFCAEIVCFTPSIFAFSPLPDTSGSWGGDSKSRSGIEKCHLAHYFERSEREHCNLGDSDAWNWLSPSPSKNLVSPPQPGYRGGRKSY